MNKTLNTKSHIIGYTDVVYCVTCVPHSTTFPFSGAQIEVRTHC